MANAFGVDVVYAHVGNAVAMCVLAVARASVPFARAEHHILRTGNFFDVFRFVKAFFDTDFSHFCQRI